MVHFYGHGGRYIWRTGPPDYEKNHDLFGLDDLEQLAPSDRLPVVLSLSCFTAPFDHPNADSIGEKFLRLPDRGAVAVLGASWRNTPHQAFSEALIGELSRPGTVGEAVLAAKRSSRRRIMVETYNLLGDPASSLTAPPETLRVEGDERSVLVEGDFDHGEAIVEWLGKGGDVVRSRTLRVAGGSFEARPDAQRAPDVPVHAVRVYVWDAERNADALGYLDLSPRVSPEEPREELLGAVTEAPERPSS